MKKLFFLLSLLLVIFAAISFSKKGKIVKTAITSYVVPTSLVNKAGNMVSSRIKVPEGYTRISSQPSTFSSYVTNYNLKPFGAEVINYDGKPYWYQAGHVGVLDIPVPSNGLQQCADALMRIRSEFLWDMGRKEDIGFKFTSGHYCSWSNYAQGYRPKVKGNTVTFSKTAIADNSKDNFYKFLNLIYTYAGTYSLAQELNTIENLEDVKIGDMLVYPGFPGHIMMIAAIAENPQGERLFLFFQGNTPAQSVHIIKNATNTTMNPWYSLDGKQSLTTPIYTFDSFKIVRFK